MNIIFKGKTEKGLPLFIRYPTLRQKGIIALILLAFVFASMGLFARYLSTGFLLFQQVYLRVFVAFFLALILFRKDLNLSKFRIISQKEWLLLIFRSACQYVLGVTLYTQAIILTKFSNVSFIQALPMTALLGVFLVGEKLTWQKLLFLTTAFAGVFLIAIKDYTQIFNWGYGQLLALLATISFSTGYVTRRWHTNLLNNKEITTLLLGFALLMIIPASLFFGEGLPTMGWTANLFLAVVGAGLFNLTNLFLLNFGFQYVEVVLASNILTLESVFAIALGFLFYKEFPSLKELLGGLLIIGSVVKMNRIEEQN